MTWDPAAAVARIRQREVSPFEVDVELQEEIVFNDYDFEGPQANQGNDRDVYRLTDRQIEFDVVVSRSSEGDTVREKLQTLLKKKSTRPTLFGLMHYASCRLVVQALTMVSSDGPDYLTISDKSVDRKALLAALKFT